MERRSEPVCRGRSREAGEIKAEKEKKRLQGPPGKGLSDIEGEQEFVGAGSVWAQDLFQNLSTLSLSGGWCTGVHVSGSTVLVGSWGSEVELSGS